MIDDANNSHSIVDLAVSLGAARLEKAGVHARKTICLIHNERTASLHLYPGRNNFHCFGCGANGDNIRLVQLVRHVGFNDALRILGAAELPHFSPEKRAELIRVEDQERREAIAAARAFFADAETVTAADPGGRYLLARGIMLPVPGTVRFGMVPARQDPDTKEWGRKRPALVCGCQDDTGNFCAIQRIFVDGPKPDKAAAKLSLGALKGAALRLGPPQSRVSMAEGPEDGLAFRQLHPDRSVWVPCGTGLWPFVQFPGEVSEVEFAGQDDAPGRAAVAKSENAFLEQGLATSRIFPALAGMDWNEYLRAAG